MKFVAPTLWTRLCGRCSGSRTTSGSPARVSSLTCAAVYMLVTAIRARRPADTRSRAQCGAGADLLITTEAPSSAAASMMPSSASAEYVFRSLLNCTSIVGFSAVSVCRNTGAR